MGEFCMLYLTLGSSLSIVALKEEILVSVSRRLSGDSYSVTAFNTTDQLICHDSGNLTLLASERRCINNEELFNGKLDKPKINVLQNVTLPSIIMTSDCNFIIAMTEEESSNHRLALIIDFRNDTELITAATTFNSSDNLTDAVIYHRSTDQPVKSSFCHIASLEV